MVNFVGFRLTKITAERISQEFKDLKINTSINLDSIEELSEEKKGQKILSISFNYSIEYFKDVAKIEFGGKLFVSGTPEEAKNITKNWVKKKLDENLKVEIFNMILFKSNIKAVQVEEELGLPTHFQMPSLSLSKE